MGRYLDLLTPRQRYEKDLSQAGFQVDAAQQAAVELLEDLYRRLKERELEERNRGFWSRLTNSRPKPLQGLYFWGGVGRGKTYLMDIFFDCLPFEKKHRSHFHRFMRDVHKQLKHLEGQKNPLLKVADNLAEKMRVLCFDEFFVSDITDAMILAGLLEALFDRGVTLVATSNIVPDELYRDGLQRARFLPAIELLNLHTQVVNVDGGVDYRLRTLEQVALYHSPLNAVAEKKLQESFLALAPDCEEICEPSEVEIEGRVIRAVRECEDIIWFQFEQLCEGPRSQNDYIELAREYHAVVLSEVPQLSAEKEDAARRFINLVDEFYDRGVKLLISAAVPIDSIYDSGRLEFEFQRTCSRLLEMQSKEYLARAHRP